MYVAIYSPAEGRSEYLVQNIQEGSSPPSGRISSDDEGREPLLPPPPPPEEEREEEEEEVEPIQLLVERFSG